MPDVKTEVVIPEVYIQRMLDVLDMAADKSIYIRVGSHQLHLSASFVFEDKKAGENNIDFLERLQRKFLLTLLKIKAEDTYRKNVSVEVSKIAVGKDPVTDNMIL